MTNNMNLGHIGANLFSALVAEYGMGFQHPGDVGHWQRITAAKSRRSMESHERYAGVCQLKLCKTGALRVDRRLLCVGFNNVSPTVWLGGELDRFLAYWKKAVPRPDTVGSCYNPNPDSVYKAMRAHLPPWAALAGEYIRGKGARMSAKARKRHMLQGRALNRMSGESLRYLKENFELPNDVTTKRAKDALHDEWSSRFPNFPSLELTF